MAKRLNYAMPSVLTLLVMATAAAGAEAGAFARRWVYASETSAVVYWQLADIRRTARSFVEYGPTKALGRKTKLTAEPRWSHFHRLTGLETGKTYHCRTVVVEAATKNRTEGEVFTFATRKRPGAIRIPQQVSGPPFLLDKAGATYVLTRDVRADGTAFVITAPGVTLDLDGHAVVFGNDTDEQVGGVWARSKGKATICNGHVVQGARSKAYSTAVESRWRAEPTEIFGISTDVHLRCAYPIKFLGRAAGVHVHHNVLYSRVTEIESRHYPGNDLLRLDVSGADVHVHDNILTEGCHVGIRLSGTGTGVEVHHNDIRHHQQYVNGYAIAAACPAARIHHNRISSCGRGVHLTREGIRLHDNYLDIYGHQQLDDIPAKSRPFKHHRVELHGVKFEGGKVKSCKVSNNFVRIVQKRPHDSGGAGSPDDKLTTGVYVRSRATSLATGRLVDARQQWEKDRWKGYFVKYAPKLPAARIAGNDATTLYGKFAPGEAGEYAIYMKWQYVPATPLNVACYDPAAMNEVCDNTFVALTEYRKTRHGGYGDSGQWAAAIYFVSMTRGAAPAGKHAVWIHGNRFVSNDLFVAATRPVNMTVRVEGNTFVLAKDPPPTETHTPFRRLGGALEASVKAGGNRFEEMKP